MKQFGIAFLFCVVCIAARHPLVQAQHATVPVDWRAELEKAKAGINKNPSSAFWHNQAGVAYDALGDDRAVKELKLASRLDPTNTVSDYALYALYRRKGTIAQEREILLKALDKDSVNPLGRLEFAYVLEREGHLRDAVREYQAAKHLAVAVKEPQYIDPRGNPYDIGSIPDEADEAIDRVTKLIATEQRSK